MRSVGFNLDHFCAQTRRQIAYSSAARSRKIIRNQLVTIPVLDARLQELRIEILTFRAEIKAEVATGAGKLETEIHKVNANLMRWVLLTMLGSVTLSMAGKALMTTLGY